LDRFIQFINQTNIVPRRDFIKQVYNFILDLIFPIECLGCGKEGEYLCKTCLNSIELMSNPTCPVCGRPSPQGKVCVQCQKTSVLEGVIAAVDYQKDNLLQKVLHIYKYRFVRDLHKFLSRLLSRYLERSDTRCELLDDAKATLIIPVPLHRQRLRWRGFNQSELLAQDLSDYLGLEVNSKALIRFKKTEPQMTLKGKERRKNVKEVFECVDTVRVKDRNIILIDDVCTTSSTLNECAKVLKDARAGKVWGVVVARG